MDATALRAALEDAAGRDYLLDLLALRGLVHVYIHLDGQGPAVPSASHASTHTARSVLRALAAIAVLAIAGAGGFAWGRRTDRGTLATNAATIAPAATTPSAIDVTSAPEPTRVIRLESGVDWRQRAGGH